MSVAQATSRLKGMRVSDKNELLFQHGINVNHLPAWQLRGIGLYWQEYEKPATNPVTGEAVISTRRKIVRDLNLPRGDVYSAYLERLVSSAG
jgi:tRNA(His) 5'-end guanylyltransferase